MPRDGIPHIVVSADLDYGVMRLVAAQEIPDLLRLDLGDALARFKGELANIWTVQRMNAEIREFLMAARARGDLWMDYSKRWRYLV